MRRIAAGRATTLFALVSVTFLLTLAASDAAAHWRVLGRWQWGTYPYGYAGYNAWGGCCGPMLGGMSTYAKYCYPGSGCGLGSPNRPGYARPGGYNTYPYPGGPMYPRQTQSAPAQSVPDQRPLTVLTLKVPADATVYLGGNRTSSTGTRRVYATHAIAPRDAYKAYEVRVEVQRGGQTFAETRTIDLAAGDARALSFGDSSLASHTRP